MSNSVGSLFCVCFIFSLGVNVFAQSGANTPPDFPKFYKKNDNRNQSNPGTQSLPEHDCPVALFNVTKVSVNYRYVFSYSDPFDSSMSVPHPNWNTDNIEASSDGKCLKQTSNSEDEGQYWRYFIYVTRDERREKSIRPRACGDALQYKVQVGKRYAFFVNDDGCLDLGLAHEKD